MITILFDRGSSLVPNERMPPPLPRSVAARPVISLSRPFVRCGTLIVTVALTVVALARAQQPVIPADSMMGTADKGMQRLLLNPLDAGDVLSTNAWKITDPVAVVDPGVEPKAGLVAMKFAGKADSGGAKGDFVVSNPPATELSALGLWVNLTPDANVSTVGFQVYDAEGEALYCLVSADWTGWKWVEMDLKKAAFKPAYSQPDKNGKLDFPLKGINVVWFTKNAGPTALTVDALTALRPVAESKSREAYGFDLVSPIWGEPDQPLKAQLLLTNYTDQPQTLSLRYSVQTNASLYDKSLPDPVLGSDHAQGCKSWVEINGERIEDGSLTDDDDATGYHSPNNKEGYAEGFQVVDLGKARRVVGLAYQAGDANWIYNVDLSASTDGSTYQPVSGLQDLDFNKKWGHQTLVVKEPFTARFVRLRYYKKDGRSNDFRLPNALYVYDGVADEKLEVPKVGESSEEKEIKVTVGPRNFSLVSANTTNVLKTGSYLFGVRIQGSSGTSVKIADYFVMPPAGLTLRPESRFGMNVAHPKYIPMLQRLGTGWVRFENMKWMMYTPAADTFRFDGSVSPWNVPYDDYIRQYRAAGISFLPYIFQTPEWATSAPAGVTKNRPSYPPKDFADYGKAVYEVTARYGATKHPAGELKSPDGKSGLGQLTTYELWNEPNLNDPGWGFFVGPLDRYFDLFRAGAEGAKRGDPKARVTTAGFAGLSMDWIDRLRTYKYPDGKTPLDFADVLNVHFYSGRQEPEYATKDPNAYRNGAKPEGIRTYEKDLSDIADWRDDLKPGMPIWLTETGNDVGGPIGRTERLQAAKIPRCLMIALATGVEKVFLYRETGSTPAQHAGAGVMRDDGTLRPSFFTLATLTRQLDGVTDTRVPRLQIPGSKAWMYRWKRGAEDVVTVWTPEGTEPLGIDLGRCTVTDAFGSVSEQQVGKDFSLGIFPVYLTHIGNPAPLDGLVRQATDQLAHTKKLKEFALTARAYLFDFGSRERVGTKMLGRPRPFVPVLSTDMYDEAQGYGFTAAVKGKDVVRGWVQGDLETDAVAMWGPATFKVDAKPGMYDVEFKGEDFAENSKLVIGGAKEGSIALPLPNEKKKSSVPLSARLTVTAGQPITFEMPGSGNVQWISLVEAAPANL